VEALQARELTVYSGDQPYVQLVGELTAPAGIRGEQCLLTGRVRSVHVSPDLGREGRGKELIASDRGPRVGCRADAEYTGCPDANHNDGKEHADADKSGRGPLGKASHLIMVRVLGPESPHFRAIKYR
jgi:hypothetical protein